MSPEHWMIAAMALPALASLGVACTGTRPNLRESITIASACATFAAVVVLGRSVVAGESVTLRGIEIFPGVPIAFGLEPLGLLYAAVAAGLWIPTSLYSIGYMRGHHETHQTRFYACFALSICSALGIAFAANLLTLFLFYELLTLVTYPLVTHAGTQEARDAGRVYLGILLSTSIGFFLLAILMTGYWAETLDFRAGGVLAGKVDASRGVILLALFAFGIGKAALMPFHRWLPAAMVAPTPVSALLHAVAVVKAGVFSLLKIVLYVFGPSYLSITGISVWLTYVAAATILIASCIALRKNNLKARLAYSTVSQLAYIVLGAAIATGSSVIGAAMHIAIHAVGKITLFFCAGAIMVASHKTEISQLDGIGRRMPWTMSAFAIASLSIVGLPPLAGAWSKWFLSVGAAEDQRIVLIGVLMLSSLLSLGYLMPIVGRAFFASPANDAGTPAIREAPLLCVVPLCFTAAGSVALFFFGPKLYAMLLPLAAGAR